MWTDIVVAQQSPAMQGEGLPRSQGLLAKMNKGLRVAGQGILLPTLRHPAATVLSLGVCGVSFWG